jgi:hypothetical protein
MSTHEELLKSKWLELKNSASVGEFIRIDTTNPLALYCGFSAQGNLRLLAISQTVPKAIRGTKVVNISLTQRPDGKHALIFDLLDSKFEKEFLTLCAELYGATVQAIVEDSALSALENAYRTWAKFFQPATKMSIESARGLFAELITIRDYGFPKYGHTTTLESWRGPLGGHQDFVFAAEAVEVKSIHPDGTEVKISSEHQLNFDGPLELRICKVSDSETGEGLTLVDLVMQLSSLLDDKNKKTFVELVSEVGFSKDEPLCDSILFSDLGVLRINANSPGFPSIRVNDLNPGVSKVSYSLSLSEIRQFGAEIE